MKFFRSLLVMINTGFRNKYALFRSNRLVHRIGDPHPVSIIFMSGILAFLAVTPSDANPSLNLFIKSTTTDKTMNARCSG